MIVIKRNDGKVVGQFRDGFYETTRNQKDHYYWKGRGYPIDVAILEQLKSLSCHTIVIAEVLSTKRTRKHYFAFNDYWDAEAFHHPPYEPQKCVPLKSAEASIDANDILFW